jgi:multimeric flavodoxin WrbA
MVKTFMDRTRKLKMSNHMLDGKVLAPIAVSALRHGGGSGVIDAIIRLGFDQRMIIVSAPSNPLKDSPFPVGSLQTDTGWRITKEDPIGIKDAKNLGIRVVEVTKALKKYKKGGDSG